MKQATTGYAALERGGPIVPFSFDRRALRPHDVALEIHYCGVCHTDLHSIGKWGQEFPLVPGHEIAGVVREVGSEVSAFAPGDAALIGTIVDACRTCEALYVRRNALSVRCDSGAWCACTRGAGRSAARRIDHERKQDP